MSEQFNRQEIKFRMERWRLPSLRDDVERLLRKDPHNRMSTRSRWDLGGYRIRSLYFETAGMKFAQEKESGVDDRFKLRLRTYLPMTGQTPVFAEIKHRIQGSVRKTRQAITRRQVTHLLAGRHGAALEEDHGQDQAMLRAFVGLKIQTGAHQPLLIDYTREGFVYPHHRRYIRITFDSDIAYAPSPDLFQPPLALCQIRNQVIVEMKCSGDPPFWMQYLIRKHALRFESISKFQHACRLLVY